MKRAQRALVVSRSATFFDEYLRDEKRNWQKWRLKIEQRNMENEPARERDVVSFLQHRLVNYED